VRIKIRSKSRDLNKIISNWERDGTLELKKDILNKLPDNCINCGSRNIYYWDETDEEIIFQCENCKRFYPFPFNKDKLNFYFAF
jgi:hypothetical protein